jgi:hypothetical protein
MKKIDHLGIGLWCMSHMRRLTLVAAVVMVCCLGLLYVVGTALTRAEVFMIAVAAIASIAPVAVGVFTDFHLTLSKVFPVRDDK